MTAAREKRFLMLILIAAALLRLGLLTAGLQNSASLYTPDSEDYCRLAAELAEHGRFELTGQPAIFRTPGYPVFLMLREIIHPVGALVVQIFADLAVVYMTFMLGALLISKRAGLLAGLFYAISPLAMASSCRFLSDTLYVFFFMLATLLLVKNLKAGKSTPAGANLKTIACSAVALSLACYVRPVGLVMVPVFMFAMLFRPGRRAKLILFAGIIVLCLGPWVIRNITRADYVGLSSFATDSMYNTTATDIIAKKENRPAEEIREEFNLAADFYEAGPPSRTPGEVSRWRRRVALQIIRDNPTLWVRGYMKGWVGFWLPGANYALEVMGLSQGQRGTVDVLQRRGIWSAIEHYFGGNYLAITIALPMILIMLVKYFGAILCVLRSSASSMTLEVWLIVGIVLVIAFLPGPGLPRYRLPIEPILAIAAAAGLLPGRSKGT